MIFRQFVTAEDDLSYLLADPVTGQALLIDPSLAALDQYRQALGELGLSLRYVLETHLHESHVSAAATLRAGANVRVAMSDCAEANCIDQRLRNGDTVYLGEETIYAIVTPGHSQCSMAYHWRDRVFTGHTLLVGSTGHCDRGDADPSALYSSVTERLFELPGDTLVYPGRQMNGRRVSSIAQERLANEMLNSSTRLDEYQKLYARTRGELDGQAMQWLLANRECRAEQQLHNL